MATAEIQKGRIVVQTLWNEKELIKAIPGSRWNADEKHWTLPLTWAACLQLRGIFGDSLKVGEDLSGWSWHEFQVRVDPSLKLRSEFKFVDEYWHDTRLYEFQQAGVSFLTAAGSGLLGDEMGTGKTIQMLASLEATDGLPALVICPNSVKSNWAKEAKTWYPEAIPYVITGSIAKKRAQLMDATKNPRALVIVNYESTHRLSRMAGFGSMRLVRCRECDKQYGTPNLKVTLCEVHPKELNVIPFKTVIVDEAHRIKDPKAKQTRAVWALGSSSTVTRRWTLTGTPLANDPSDLWSIMHFVAPDEYPTKSKYVDRYCLQAWNVHGGLDVVGINPTTKDEFFKILDPRFRRMPKALVLDQLPQKVRTIRLVEMSPKQKKAYDELDKRMITRLANGDVLVAQNNLTAQIRLLQLSSSYCNITYGDDPNDITQWGVELCEPSPKIDELMAVLDEAGNKPIVVCAESRKLIELAAARITKANISHGLITGSIDEYERKYNLEQFQAGKLRVLLFTIKAGGVGLTMTAADTIVFLQRSWSMIDNKQAEDRVHRIGSEIHESIHVIDLITEGTVEEAQIARLGEKMKRLEEITRDRVTLAKAGKNASHLDAVEDSIMKSYLGTPE